MFERSAITTPSCVRPGRRPVCRSSVSLLACMIRSTRLPLTGGFPSAFRCRFMKRRHFGQRGGLGAGLCAHSSDMRKHS